MEEEHHLPSAPYNTPVDGLSEVSDGLDIGEVTGKRVILSGIGLTDHEGYSGDDEYDEGFYSDTDDDVSSDEDSGNNDGKEANNAIEAKKTAPERVPLPKTASFDHFVPIGVIIEHFEGVNHEKFNLGEHDLKESKYILSHADTSCTLYLYFP